jgi:Leucine-rich repeat (LRR) protein
LILKTWGLRVEQVLPESFGQLKMLTDLYMSENKFSEFPVEVTEMLSLQKLSLACNDITFLPAEIANLEELRFLDVSFNQIRQLPGAIPVGLGSVWVGLWLG